MGVLNPQLYHPRLPAVTASAAPIPPFGVVRLVSSADGVWTVATPDKDGDPGVCVNGDKTLTNAAADRGNVTFEPLQRVAYDPADGTPAAGEKWGPKRGAFLLRKGNSGFEAAGEGDGFTAVFKRVPAGGGGDLGTKSVLDRVSCDALGQIVSRYTPVYGPTVPAPPTGTSTISGTVTVSGTPTAGRAVRASFGDYEWDATTDGSGNFTMAGLPGGTYVVWAVVTGTEDTTPIAVTVPADSTGNTLAVTP